MQDLPKETSPRISDSKLSSPALTIENLCVSYGNALVLSDINITVNRGALTCVIGPNGAGKSTLVKAICGRLPIQQGRISINDVSHERPRARLDLGVTPQRPALYDQLSAEENLICFARQMGLDRTQAKQRTNYVLGLIGMEKDRDCRAVRMSGGMRQRVNIGAAILHQPSLLILDEPSASLDPSGIRQINELINRLRDEDYSMMLISHDMLQARSLADQLIILQSGKIKMKGNPARLIGEYYGKSVTLKLQCSDSNAMMENNFHDNADHPGQWMKALENREEAIALITKLMHNQIVIENSTISAPSLNDLLDDVTKERRQHV